MIEWKKVEGEKNPMMDLFSKKRLKLSDFGPDDEFIGKPMLSDIEERLDFNDPTKKNYILRFNIVDNDKYLQININLKTDEIVQRNVHKSSKLFALVDGISSLFDETWTDYDLIKEVNIKDLCDFVNSCDRIAVSILEVEADFGLYNSFKIRELI